MYCKNCGAENLANANYCIHDGAFLKSPSVKFRTKERNSTFCSSCGAKTESPFNYCTACGSSTNHYSFEKGTNTAPKEISNRAAALPQKLPGIKLTYVKQLLLPALLALIIIFGLAFTVMKSSEQVFNSMLDDSLGEMDFAGLVEELEDVTNTKAPKLDQLFGISDIVMAANLQNPIVTVKAFQERNGDREERTATAEAKNGFLLYLLIPFIGLFAAGIFAARRNHSTRLEDHLANAAGIALLYALFMTLFSLFAGFSYDFSIDEKRMNLGVDINTDYSLFKVLFMTFIFGFLFSGLGSLFATAYRKTTGHLSEWLSSGEAIHQAMAIPVRGIFIFSIGLFVYLSIKLAEFKEAVSFLLDSSMEEILNKSYILVATVSVQLGSYLWNLLHFSPLTFMLQDDRQEGTISYGVFSGFEATGEARDTDFFMLEHMLEQADLDIYLKLAMLIPVALFLWAGYKIACKSHVIKNLIIFSLVYAVMMAALASFTDIGFAFSAESGLRSDRETTAAAELGFGPVGTFIKSLLLSFVFAFLGTFFHRWKKSM